MDIGSANFWGEILRDMTFTDDGFGCYSNFDLRSGFRKIAKTPTRLLDIQDEIEWSQFYNPALGIFVAWYWDGDGTLYFEYPGIRLIHNDCKNDYEWEFLPAKIEIVRGFDGIYLKK